MPSFMKIDSGLHATYTETDNPNRDFDLHYHHIYELYYFVDGDADYQVEGRQYHLTPNSIILLAPYVLHGVRINSAKTYKRFSIHFEEDSISMEHRSVLLTPFPAKDIASQGEVYYTDIQDFGVRSLLEAFVRCKTSASSLSTKLDHIYLEAVLAELVFLCRKVHQVENTFVVSKPVTDVIQYINTHLSEKITLAGLSERFFLNKDYLNRLFKKKLGITVADYVTHKRIGYAQHLLETGKPASEVAIAVGFNDYSSFYRAYKKITMRSPREHAKK